jgi:hypothetical protein
MTDATESAGTPPAARAAAAPAGVGNASYLKPSMI